MEEEFDKRDREIVDESIKRLAKALNLIEAATEQLEFMFEEHPDWNDTVYVHIKEASSKLGFSLARLIRWFED